MTHLSVSKLWVVSIIIILDLTLVIFRAEKLCWRGILLLCRNKVLVVRNKTKNDAIFIGLFLLIGKNSFLYFIFLCLDTLNFYTSKKLNVY